MIRDAFLWLIIVFTFLFLPWHICRELSRIQDENAILTYQLRQQIAEQRRTLNAFWCQETERTGSARKSTITSNKESRRGKVN